MKVFSIADAPSSIEFFSVEDWQAVIDIGDPIAEAAFLSKADQAISLQLDGLAAPVIWGFSKLDRTPNSVTILGDVSAFKEIEQLERRLRLQRRFFCAWFNVLQDGMLRDLRIDKIIGDLIDNKACGDIEEQFLRKLKVEINVEYDSNWAEFDKAIYYYIYKKYNNGSNTGNVHRRAEELLRTLYDATLLRNRVNKDIPWPEIARLVGERSEEWENVFYGPKEFDPFEDRNPDRFHWPWQRCMRGCNSEGAKSLELRSIPTTSLVADLRHSTKAMGLFSPPERYAELLDELVAECRKKIRNAGAFFDKETGDGFVAHFCRSSFEATKYGSASLSVEIERAARLGRELIDVSSDICKRYGGSLKHGIGALQLSVGIHSEDAVWICDKERIRAIGSSVVWASRLCASAAPGEILISNHAHETLANGQASKLVADFKKREVFFKEYDKKVKLYAYSNVIWSGMI